MKLVSFKHGDAVSYGVVSGEVIADVGSRLKPGLPTLRDALVQLDEVEAQASGAPQIGLENVELLPPITNPERVICIGMNYKAHIAEIGRDPPKYPILFARYPDSLVGHRQAIVRPHVSIKLDFEGELAVVIGKEGRYVKAEDALDHVAGYSCFNDGSIRDYQLHSSQFLPGKTFWHSGSFGPWLVTPAEIPSVDQMHLQTRLNGKVMQDTTIGDLLFNVQALIAYISEVLPLKPGDVIATGTTGGVGIFRDPQVWMKPGDTVEVEISGVGILSNPIVDE